MDLELSLEQQELRDGLRRMLEDRCDRDARRAALEQPGAVDRELWKQLADTGVFALRLPEEEGGLGAGLAEAVIVQEEIGRAALPGPVAVTSLLAGQVPGARDGSLVATALFARTLPCMVEHLEGADVVAVLSPGGARIVDPSSLDGRAAAPLDPLSPIHRCAQPGPGGTELAGAAGLWRDGTLLAAATHVGLGAAAVEMAAAYAKERTQFGRPIGSFQAVKHLLADALAAIEVARAAVHSASVHLDERLPEGESTRAVASARVLASRAGRAAAEACIQVHGGMGYTWELDAHLYLKRVLVVDTHFDTPYAARGRLLAGL